MSTYTYNGAPLRTRRVLFTGQSIHQTPASRTAVPVPAIGSVLIRDPFAADAAGNLLGGANAIDGVSGTGQYRDSAAFTRPQANFLHMPKVVVVRVEDNPAPGLTGLGSNARWCEVLDVGEAVPALVTRTAAALSPGQILGPVAGQYHLAILPTTSVAELTTVLQQACGIMLETASSGTDTVLRLVKLGGPFNHGN